MIKSLSKILKRVEQDLDEVNKDPEALAPSDLKSKYREFKHTVDEINAVFFTTHFDRRAFFEFSLDCQGKTNDFSWRSIDNISRAALMEANAVNAGRIEVERKLAALQTKLDGGLK